MLTLSQEKGDRLVHLRLVHVGRGRAANTWGRRHFRRLRWHFEARAAGGCRTGVCRRPTGAGAGKGAGSHCITTLARHCFQSLARDPEIGFVHPATLRRWMIADGLWNPGQAAPQAQGALCGLGALVLMDTDALEVLGVVERKASPCLT